MSTQRLDIHEPARIELESGSRALHLPRGSLRSGVNAAVKCAKCVLTRWYSAHVFFLRGAFLRRLVPVRDVVLLPALARLLRVLRFLVARVVRFLVARLAGAFFVVRALDRAADHFMFI
ncbi:MAG: hypothetical protein ACOY0T_35165 [Myxococcota bacterium]